MPQSDSNRPIDVSFEPRTPSVTSTPPVSSKRPSMLARASQHPAGQLSTKVVKGLTIASGVVGIASTVAHAVGHEQAVTLIAQLGELLKLIGGLFGG